jgi:hypothetical protein
MPEKDRWLEHSRPSNPATPDLQIGRIGHQNDPNRTRPAPLIWGISNGHREKEVRHASNHHRRWRFSRSRIHRHAWYCDRRYLFGFVPEDVCLVQQELQAVRHQLFHQVHQREGELHRPVQIGGDGPAQEGERFYLLGGVEVPATNPQPFDYQVLAALMKVW